MATYYDKIDALIEVHTTNHEVDVEARMEYSDSAGGLLPHYSTHNDDADRALEWLERNRKGVSCVRQPNGTYMTTYIDGRTLRGTVHQTRPMSICLAMLESLGITDQQIEAYGKLPEVPMATDIPERVAAIALQCGYDPSRRYENRGGYEPMTSKQRYFIENRTKDADREFIENMKLVIGTYWNADFDEWRKADAMFCIGRLWGK